MVEVVVKFTGHYVQQATKACGRLRDPKLLVSGDRGEVAVFFLIFHKNRNPDPYADFRLNP